MKTYFRKKDKFLSIVLLYLTTISCVSTKSLIIEIPQESKNELPNRVQSLLLVSRVVDESFTDLEADSLQKIFYNQNFNYDTIINDVQAVDTTLKALGELLFESGRYDFVIPENRFLTFEKNTFLSREMPWTEVKNLCGLYNTDALLSLDHFVTRVSTQYEKESYFNPIQNGFSSISATEMKIVYEALFRIYDPSNEKILVREFMRDTIIWEDRDVSTRDLFDRATPVKTAIAEAGIALALDFSDKISTVWRPERRSFFAKGDKNLKNAANFISANEWATAMALWRETAENTNSKADKSKAEFNIALGYEIQGNLVEAIRWALKSYDTMYRANTYNYLETLKRRKNELKKQQP